MRRDQLCEGIDCLQRVLYSEVVDQSEQKIDVSVVRILPSTLVEDDYNQLEELHLDQLFISLSDQT
jgi:uncharacterized radical SAM superfamily Fe-S cluster-containing enzyme